MEEGDPDLEPEADEINFQDAFKSRKLKEIRESPSQTLDSLKQVPGRLSKELVKQGLLSPELLEQLKREWEAAKGNEAVPYEEGDDCVDPPKRKGGSKSGRTVRKTKKK